MRVRAGFSEADWLNEKLGGVSKSLKRGAGSIETDYLNGEIVLLGRLSS